MARAPKKSEAVHPPEEEVVDSANESVDVEHVDSAQYLQCGAVLSAERSEQGLSVKEVAKQLRLSSTQVDALEEDNYASLPEATIVKGFIRNYAKLLKIPAEPLINAYSQMVPTKEDYAFALNPGINMKITESGKSHKGLYFLIFMAALLSVGAWFFYQNYVQKPNPINPMPEIAEALPELALPMSERTGSVATQGAATQIAIPGQAQLPIEGTVQHTPEATLSTDAPEVTAPEEKAGESEVELIAEKTLTSPEEPKAETGETLASEMDAVATDTPPAAGKTRLIFMATQETWISVVNTSGREVFSKILYAGGREVVDVRKPSEIVVGNAHGATLSVDGKPVDLAPYTRVNVARIRVSRLR